MERGKSVSTKPLTAENIRERLELARQLVALGTEQIRKAQGDLNVAKVGLYELEADLAARGVDLEGGK